MHFAGDDEATNHFKVVHLSGSSLLLGARNVVYNISLDTMKENKRIHWPAEEGDMKICGFKQKTTDECQNYIRVIAPTESGGFLVCGTNAFKPSCRKYMDMPDMTYKLLASESGLAKCPFDPTHNNTALYAGDRFFSATVSDMSARDALIYSDSVRTVQHDSQWLNEPDFVSSFEHEDKVYFFFRETAVEYINCGKARFSRVARVCKNDRGGERMLRNTFTSFFKARLNCSIPGEYPFYFDEIQSTSDIGKGNVIPSVVLSDRETMIYAVFTTPQNSIGGSAVCAFRFSDVLKTFEGPFKEQKSASSNWLPVKESEHPIPHPAKTCINDSYNIQSSHLNFIKTHPLMDKAVPTFGGAPILYSASFNYRMTTIAIDWQFRAADDRYYDILFIGTDHGHVLKAINKGSITSMDPVIIEDLEVFPNQPVLELKVYRNFGAGEEKLIVVSANQIQNIPLHRCQIHPTCTACVAAQDPYCAWFNGACAKTNTRSVYFSGIKFDCEYLNFFNSGSIQSLQTGEHPQCPESELKDPGIILFEVYLFYFYK
ncbi:hypothetical protein CAPTEDRAFT_179561 [Capitella teleta]|uniref:Sema domain-containing protein n=1 Tax=Capitella teleta TaxID=283909 RepID=R7UTK7_CAPTE|nr:hypothetical protein CAPTEDRAFT_179561 [Capitella teleta]|eukprot:ELU06726.1 hypothetical protein CAPTEDRAFT_179561 [Capitella teleta]